MRREVFYHGDVTLVMEAIISCETSAHVHQAALCNIPKDGIFIHVSVRKSGLRWINRKIWKV
jgi:hypothetical protein